MTAEIIFRGKRILAVDDEPDVLALITEGLHDVEVVTAGDFEHARRIIEGEKFHLVLLDIMGVNGFELLKMCTERKLPAAMLTARAITIDSVNLSLKLGAVSFLPKEETREHPRTCGRDPGGAGARKKPLEEAVRAIWAALQRKIRDILGAAGQSKST